MFQKTIILMHPPKVSLSRWKVLEVASPGLEAPTLHLIGWTGHNVRVSSPIFECDAVMRSCMTGSRNIYQLQGEAAQTLDQGAAELWDDWTKKNGVITTADVTEAVADVFRQVDDERGFWPENMPADFPQDRFLGALPGQQLKYLGRHIDGKYVVGPTKDELQQRYQLCVRLAAQYHRLHLQFSEQDASASAAMPPRLAEVFVYVALSSWDLSARERAWIIEKIETMPKTAAK